MRFADLSLIPPLVQVAQELGFTELTPIQAESIPVLLKGLDLIGQSQTGSGKTVAFALPILQKVKRSPREVQALILCPTRELCAQVTAEFRRLGRKLSELRVLELAGGQLVRPQLGSLRKGAHIAVGTPGRILDLLERKALDTRHIETVVLDEADRMLEMGFQEDMARILAAMPACRQTALFSATFPSTIETLSSNFQRAPVRVTIEALPEFAPDISQRLYTCSVEERPAMLLRLLRQYQPGSTIVFCNFKATVADLAKTLRAGGVSCAALQGNLQQRERDQVMATFRNRSARVLVATDVAARGIDVESLDAVFNYELPQQPEIYLHRIGRTGRAGRQGLALSLASPSEERKVNEIERFTGSTFERVDFEPELSPPPVLEATMATLFIGAGRKEKMRPGDILGALTGDAGGLSATSVGKIEIHDHFAYVAVTRDVARSALERLRAGTIKGKKHRVEAVTGV